LGTLPPGAQLPSDAECRQRVRVAAENRPGNRTYNLTVGHQAQPEPPYFNLAGRITGNYTGTTDQIIQWVACKWGIDENVARAQVALESWWHQDAAGDFTTNPAHCAPGHPIGADGRPGMCPESIGLGQVRTQYVGSHINDAAASSAYNLDYTYAIWRSCFEGHETWLNTVERGRQYAKGDLWGCVGRWFSGRWYTSDATGYIARVQDYLNRRIWTTPEFANG
jgi:autotransporter family porin